MTSLHALGISHANSTPLISAVTMGLNAVVDYLIECGADVNASTIIDNDDTALIMAAKIGNERAAKSLIAHGAQIERKNRWGDDAATYANRGQHWQILQLLKVEKRTLKASVKTGTE